ncbi:hypothetical protein MIU24_02660 [Streptomyces venezuelae]|uniref:hypothetical protein n=1 Tax=Streptomyces sp. B6(2022) TaxID=3404749 RepID=UPI003120429B
MKPRNFVALLNVPKAKRYVIVAEGLKLLSEHVATLRGDLVHLQEAGRHRSAPVIDGLASEEAAKILILLDVVRMGWTNDTAVRDQLRRLHQHLARGIYCKVVAGAPADLAEVRRYTESLRRSHYLDGPNDVDWIFRNSVDSDREEQLYVDYVTYENGSFWTTPATRNSQDSDLWPDRASLVIDLVLSLQRFGCMTEKGLEIIAKVWDGVAVADDTHWSEIQALNEQVLRSLGAADLYGHDLTNDDARLAMQHWTFPLSGIELAPIEVKASELQAERERWIANQW